MLGKRLLIVTAILSMGLTGCASISEDQCRLGDWYQLGLQDGQQGKTNQAANYSGDCAEYKVSVDTAKYNQGRDEGLKTFCTYDNGAFLGQNNQSYDNVCPSDLAKDFMAGYRPHRTLAKAKASLSERERTLSNYRAQYEAAEKDSDEKKRLKAHIKTAKNQVSRAKTDVNRYEYELALHKVEREISTVNQLLENDKLSELERQRLQDRHGSLVRQKEQLEDVFTVEKTIRNLKDFVDLF